MDITVLEVADTQPVSYIVVKTDGNDMGSTRIDREFENELEKVFGSRAIDKLKVCRAQTSNVNAVNHVHVYGCAERGTPRHARDHGLV